MRHKIDNSENFIKAGAYYRLLKTVAAYCADGITNNLDLTVKEQGKIYGIYDKILKLECEIGFENLLEQYCNKPEFAELNDRFVDVFYGAISLSAHPTSYVDARIIDEVKTIIPEMLEIEEDA